MAEIVLREITRENFRECISLMLEPWQQELVAPNVESLAEATIDPTLVPLAIYDRAALGAPLSDHRMVGFTMYRPVAAVGFIKRVMIDKRHQRQGYARAAMREVIRRLRLHPEAQLIGTPHRRCNEAAAIYIAASVSSPGKLLGRTAIWMSSKWHCTKQGRRAP